MTTDAIGTEINIQLGRYTVARSHTEMLDSRIAQAADFAEVFGTQDPRASRMQCAKLHSTVARQAVRLVGLRHDVELWEADSREPRKPEDCGR